MSGGWRLAILLWGAAWSGPLCAQGRVPGFPELWPARPGLPSRSAPRPSAAANALPVGGWWAAASQGRPYGLTVLPVRRLAVGRTGRRSAWSLAWQRAGRDSLWREDAVTLDWLAGDRPAAGLRADLLTGTGMPAARWLSLVVAGQSDRWWAEGTWFLVGRGAGEGIPLLRAGLRQGRITVGGVLVRTGTGPAGAVAFWWRAATVAVGLRLAPETGSLGWLLAVRRSGTVIRLAVLFHPALGGSRFWELAWGSAARVP